MISFPFPWVDPFPAETIDSSWVFGPTTLFLLKTHRFLDGSIPWTEPWSVTDGWRYDKPYPLSGSMRWYRPPLLLPSILPRKGISEGKFHHVYHFLFSIFLGLPTSFPSMLVCWRLEIYYGNGNGNGNGTYGTYNIYIHIFPWIPVCVHWITYSRGLNMLKSQLLLMNFSCSLLTRCWSTMSTHSGNLSFFWLASRGFPQ